MTTTKRSWEAYEESYRAKEMKRLADWIQAGESGAVVGLVGCGRSNLLGFLCYRPEVLDNYLPAETHRPAPIPVDLNDLPAHNLATLYRIILRAFDRVSDHLEPTMQRTVKQLYQAHLPERDPFVTQSALHDLLLLFQAQQTRVVLVLNRFDRFCNRATPQMINTLRALRDNFKDTLCYLVGMRQEVAYLDNPEALGDMYDLLDSQVCWVGTMSPEDARFVVHQATHAAAQPPSEVEIEAILKLTGNFPALTRTVSQWWLTGPPTLPPTQWAKLLQARSPIRYRLDQLWEGLTQEEQYVLAKIQGLQTTQKDKDLKQGFQKLAEAHRDGLQRVLEKGLCLPVKVGWQIFGELLFSYVETLEGRPLGTIWLDEHGQIFQGSEPITALPNLQYKILEFFIKHPYKRNDYYTIISNCWPADVSAEGVTTVAVQFHIRELRKLLEPNPAKPVYIINWRGNRAEFHEGGYLFYPEGRPN